MKLHVLYTCRLSNENILIPMLSHEMIVKIDLSRASASVRSIFTIIEWDNIGSKIFKLDNRVLYHIFNFHEHFYWFLIHFLQYFCAKYRHVFLNDVTNNNSNDVTGRPWERKKWVFESLQLIGYKKRCGMLIFVI